MQEKFLSSGKKMFPFSKFLYKEIPVFSNGHSLDTAGSPCPARTPGILLRNETALVARYVRREKSEKKICLAGNCKADFI